MGEGKSPSASGPQNVTAPEGEKEWGGQDPGASLPTLKLSFPACQHRGINILCVSLRLTPKEEETIDVETQGKKEPHRPVLLKPRGLQSCFF